MNLIFLSLVSQSQAQEGLRLTSEIAGEVGKGLVKLWNKCTLKEAPADGHMCYCEKYEQHQHGVGELPLHCNSKQICRDGKCVESKAVRKKCTSLDRCVEGQGQCSGSHACWGVLICGEKSCGAVRKALFKEEDGALFEQGYVADVKDPTMMHKNNHCCCKEGTDGCTERTSPLLLGENCEKRGKCGKPYECKQAYKGLMWTCQFANKAAADKYNMIIASESWSPIKRIFSFIGGAQIKEGQKIDYQQDIDIAEEAVEEAVEEETKTPGTNGVLGP